MVGSVIGDQHTWHPDYDLPEDSPATVLQREQDQTGFVDTVARAIDGRQYNQTMVSLSRTEWGGKKLVGGLAETSQLSAQTFIDKRRLHELAGEHGVSVEARSDEPLIKIPTANFVYAEGFTSWKGRSGTKQEDVVGATNRSSAKVIADFASRETPAPPLDRVVGYVQPNGVVLYASADGAHRTAAAIVRGDEFIQTTRLELHQLEANLISLDDTRPPIVEQAQ